MKTHQAQSHKITESKKIEDIFERRWKNLVGKPLLASFRASIPPKHQHQELFPFLTSSTFTSIKSITMAPKKKVERAATENISLGPQVREGNAKIPTSHKSHINPNSPGELVFGVARIFASFNDTFVHVTDLRSPKPLHRKNAT